jgi:hypothetical protein
MPEIHDGAAERRYSVLVLAATAIVTACASTRTTTVSTSSSAPSPATAVPNGAAASNARSGPASGGAVGTVDSVSMSGFTLVTSTGMKVVVTRIPATTYEKGTSSASPGAITSGDRVLVFGTTSGATITATRVVVQPSRGGSATSSSTAVIPFRSGAPTVSKRAGEIPANYTQGSGTIVSGAKANAATEAALAAYEGGIVDRVVQLSDGEYEVHNIGVSWPHHIFVNQNFKVIGAN